MEFFDVLHMRQSVRRYTEQKVRKRILPPLWKRHNWLLSACITIKVMF